MARHSGKGHLEPKECSPCVMRSTSPRAMPYCTQRSHDCMQQVQRSSCLRVALAGLESPLRPLQPLRLMRQNGPPACRAPAGPAGSWAGWPPASTPTCPAILGLRRRPRFLLRCRKQACCRRDCRPPEMWARWPGRAAAPPRAGHRRPPYRLRSAPADPQHCAPATSKASGHGFGQAAPVQMSYSETDSSQAASSSTGVLCQTHWRGSPRPSPANCRTRAASWQPSAGPLLCFRARNLLQQWPSH